MTATEIILAILAMWAIPYLALATLIAWDYYRHPRRADLYVIHNQENQWESKINPSARP